MTQERKDTILIVDDVPENLEIMANLLSPEYAVMGALNGRKALEISQSAPGPDLILLDVVMPDLNGFETCMLLKSDLRTKAIPVIFVSAQTEVIDEERGLGVGGVDYLTKPVNPTIVRARVKTHLALAMAHRDLVTQNQILQENARLLEQIEQIARHDLKGPLTIFMNASDFMERGNNLNEYQLEFLKTLNESALKMLRMIDRSMDLYKMEKGNYLVKRAPVHLLTLVRLVCKELESLAEAKTVGCSVMLNGKVADESDTCLLSSDQVLLSSIVSNLVKNAIEASPENANVIISLVDQDPFLIEIRNQGVIPAEIKARFLERFVTAGKKRGTGLGGYSARLMTRALGGEITFVSTPEAGTIVSVTIPHGQTKARQEAAGER